MKSKAWAAAAIIGVTATLAGIAPGTAAADEVYCNYRITTRTEIMSTHPAQGKPMRVVGYAEVGARYTSTQAAPMGYRIVGPSYRSIKASAMAQVGVCFS